MILVEVSIIVARLDENLEVQGTQMAVAAGQPFNRVTTSWARTSYAAEPGLYLS
jgi:hypothetical protein